MAISEDVLERLRKLLGLLGSDFEGERAVAGRMASDLLRQHKLTWGDVLTASAPRPRVRTWHEPKGHREAAAEYLSWPEVLTDWEQGFLKSVSGRWHLSGRQAHCLDRILPKTRDFARASGATFT